MGSPTDAELDVSALEGELNRFYDTSLGVLRKLREQDDNTDRLKELDKENERLDRKLRELEKYVRKVEGDERVAWKKVDSLEEEKDAMIREFEQEKAQLRDQLESVQKELEALREQKEADDEYINRISGVLQSRPTLKRRNRADSDGTAAAETQAKRTKHSHGPPGTPQSNTDSVHEASRLSNGLDKHVHPPVSRNKGSAAPTQGQEAENAVEELSPPWPESSTNYHASTSGIKTSQKVQGHDDRSPVSVPSPPTPKNTEAPTASPETLPKPNASSRDAKPRERSIATASDHDDEALGNSTQISIRGAAGAKKQDIQPQEQQAKDELGRKQRAGPSTGPDPSTGPSNDSIPPPWHRRLGRIIVCESCRQTGGLQCDNGQTCIPCSRSSLECVRTKCDFFAKYGDCRNTRCFRVHDEVGYKVVPRWTRKGGCPW